MELSLRFLIQVAPRSHFTNTLDAVLYANARECFNFIYSTEGVAGFFRGLAPNVVRSGIGGAFLLVSYDEFKLIFAKKPP